LSTEIASALRGRTLTFEVFPFNFKEYLYFKNINTDYYLPANRANIVNEFYHYLTQGAFPETIREQAMQQSEILRTYYYVMLYKDLIERYKIGSVSVLKFFIEKLADNLTKGFSINKIYNDLRSRGLSLDKNLLYDLIEYFENIYLSFKIERYDYSLAARQRSDKKAYFIDNGLLGIITHQFSQNFGKLLENLIFVYLRQQLGSVYEHTIFYFKQKHECDFVVFERDKATFCIQVCYDISESETRKREISGLMEAMEFFKLDVGYIITAEHEEEFFAESKKIVMKPAFKLLIDNKL
jgi:predicted AAA+ superfamily ATPase